VRPTLTHSWLRSLLSVGLALAMLAAPALGQSTSDSTTGTAPAAASSTPSPEKLESLVAPIALYPDALLAQILMASTYPLEIVEAARWLKDNPGLDSKALEAAMQKQSWDASVKSLTAFPQPLEMMSEKLTWTNQLGDAFLADQKSVMNAVQVLREKARNAGNLETNDQQKVTVEDTASGNQTQTIIIAPANPQVVYVPTYNPTVVYGAWAYPAYPPYYYYPPGYVATRSAVSFGVGLAVGSAMWGGCNWGHSNVNINVNRYNNFNQTNIKNANWNHNAQHRRGVSYGNSNLQQRYGGNQARNSQARDSFRGRADQGRQQLSKGQFDGFKGTGSASNLAGKSNRLGGAEGGLGQGKGRQNAGRGDFGGGNGFDGGNAGNRSSAFGGSRNGQQAMRNSQRGFESRGGSSRFGSGSGRSFGGGRQGGFGGMRGGGRRR
jgi:hypothetical protein